MLFPFGYGLSYSPFTYDNLILEKEQMAAGERVVVSVDVTNGGTRNGEEVVQLYVKYPESESRRPLKELKDFSRVMIGAGQTRVVTLNLDSNELATYDEKTGSYRVEPGVYRVLVGPSSDDAVLTGVEMTVR